MNYIVVQKVFRILYIVIIFTIPAPTCGLHSNLRQQPSPTNKGPCIAPYCSVTKHEAVNYVITFPCTLPLFMRFILWERQLITSTIILPQWTLQFDYPGFQEIKHDACALQFTNNFLLATQWNYALLGNPLIHNDKMKHFFLIWWLLISVHPTTGWF
jgi:hypothetical protein